MKIQKSLDKLKDILSADRQAQLKKYKSLKKVLKLLRIEKKGLEKKLSDATDEETRQEISWQEISSSLKVISMQRKKGLRVLRELKEEQKRNK
jgi:predicted phage-related endonuclease